MKRTETRKNDVVPRKPKRKAQVYNQVFDEHKKRVRGLWEKNGKFFGQFRIDGTVRQVHLEHAETVPQALSARQAIKQQIHDNTYNPPPPMRPRSAPQLDVSQDKEMLDLEVLDQSDLESRDPKLKTLITAYRKSRNLLAKKDPKTAKREDSGLRMWVAKYGDLSYSQLNSGTLLEYAEWRKERVNPNSEIGAAGWLQWPGAQGFALPPRYLFG